MSSKPILYGIVTTALMILTTNAMEDDTSYCDPMLHEERMVTEKLGTKFQAIVTQPMYLGQDSAISLIITNSKDVSVKVGSFAEIRILEDSPISLGSSIPAYIDDYYVNTDPRGFRKLQAGDTVFFNDFTAKCNYIIINFKDSATISPNIELRAIRAKYLG
jgi:hypothetical protein